MSSKSVSLYDSVSTQLLRSIFGWYIIVAIFVTGTQLTFEFFHTKDEIVKEIESYPLTFGPGIIKAVWSVDEGVLKSILIGMEKLPTVEGISIFSEEDEELISIGKVPTGEKELGTFSLEFPLLHLRGGHKIDIGTATIYSSSTIVMERIQYGFVLIVVNSLVKTMALWLLFLGFSRVILRHPLEKMARALEKINLSNLEESDVNSLKIRLPLFGRGNEPDQTSEKKRMNELEIIEKVFNRMIEDLYNAFVLRKEQEVELKENEKVLSEINDSLEKKIKERTTELQKHQELLEEMVVKRTRELEQAKEEAIQSKTDAENANQSKSEFLANMSHEIRTPLNAVTGFSELLMPLLTDPKQQSYVEGIKSAGKNLLTLINDILDLSRIEAEMMEVALGPVNLPLILNEIEKIFEAKTIEKSLYFSIEVDSDLPSSLNLDEIKVRQILLNLVGNAIKFTSEGFVRISVSMEKYKGQQEETIEVTIEVSDSGIGIPEESQKKIFAAFQQQDGQSSRKYGGTGLGLAISKRLTELMGGTVELFSRPGVGSSFKIIIPNIEVLAIEPVEDNRGEVNIDNTWFVKGKILVVDDVESNRTLLRESLEKVNLPTLVATNGEEALLMAKEYQPDAILMDIRMPVMDGFEAAEQLKVSKDTSQIPIIALTASIKLSEQYEKSSSGEPFSIFDGFLNKPVNFSLLLGLLSKSIPMVNTTPSVHEQKKGDDPAIVLTEEAKDNLPKVIETLENNFLPWSELPGENHPMKEMRQFGQNIIELGKQNEIPPLVEYGETMCEFVESFDIVNMQQQLKELGGLISFLKGN